MGQHYIPQYYLNGFCDQSEPSKIWVYEKGNNQIRCLPIIRIANENNRWPPETERYLSNEVEGPANPVLKKIRNRQPITMSDKSILAAYLITMLKRVPRGVERMKSIAPKLVDSVFDKTEAEISKLIKKNPPNKESLEKALLSLPGLKAQYQKELPIGIWFDNIKYDTAPHLFSMLPQMTWIFMTANRGQPFLTNDNPVFFFESIGIGKPDSEITFPISSEITLWANWNKKHMEGYFPQKESIIRQINRRTASNATRYVYYCEKADWVVNLINKNRFDLKRIT